MKNFNKGRGGRRRGGRRGGRGRRDRRRREGGKVGEGERIFEVVCNPSFSVLF